jgi:hypothetical protein
VKHFEEEIIYLKQCRFKDKFPEFRLSESSSQSVDGSTKQITKQVCKLPISVTVRRKAWYWSHLINEIEGSNPPDGMHVRCLCLLRVVYVAASATCWSLAQRSRIRCVCIIVCDLESTTMKRPRSHSGCCSTEMCKILSFWVNWKADNIAHSDTNRGKKKKSRFLI